VHRDNDEGTLGNGTTESSLKPPPTARLCRRRFLSIDPAPRPYLPPGRGDLHL